jgi:hypothetical protein
MSPIIRFSMKMQIALDKLYIKVAPASIISNHADVGTIRESLKTKTMDEIDDNQLMVSHSA